MHMEHINNLEHAASLLKFSTVPGQSSLFSLFEWVPWVVCVRVSRVTVLDHKLGLQALPAVCCTAPVAAERGSDSSSRKNRRFTGSQPALSEMSR